MSFDDPTAPAARQRVTLGAEQEPQSFHDHRDRDNPMVKRDPGSWSDWVNRPDSGYQIGGRRS